MKKAGPTAVVPSGVIYYAYDEAGHLIGLYETDLKVLQEMVYLGDTPVALIKQTISGGTVTTAAYYVYADQIDTPRVITRTSDNKMVWRWDGADPFGAAAADENPASLGAFGNEQRFPGQWYDKETNLHYNWFRDYDPQLGRYVQSDPIGLQGGINTYAYVEGQPAALIDSDGRLVMSTVGGFGNNTLAEAARYGVPGNAAVAVGGVSVGLSAVGTSGLACYSMVPREIKFGISLIRYILRETSNPMSPAPPPKPPPIIRQEPSSSSAPRPPWTQEPK